MMCSPRRAAGSHSPSRVQERHMTRSLPVRWLVVLTLLMPISYGTIAFAAKDGDHVEIKATHQAGILLHQESRSTHDFQRIPDGTEATVIDLGKGGQWLKLSLPDGRTGWVTSRYVRSPATDAPAPETSPAGQKPQRIEEGTVTSVADGDTLTIITANQTKLRIRMFGIAAPAPPRHQIPRPALWQGSRGLSQATRRGKASNG
jgi:hypothetical protein